MRRRVAVLTTGRQDYSILRSVLLALRDDDRFDLALFVGGMHLSRTYGHTADLVEADGFRIDERLAFLKDRSDPADDAARALTLMADALRRCRPDALVLLGDRSETCAAGLAAVIAKVPIVHLHGGEESEGAVDNALRHALTKMAHLHLVSHETHRQRVIQMGEPANCVVVVGAPGLDNALRTDLPDRSGLEVLLGTPLPDPVVIVTLHPTTLGAPPLDEWRAMACAMERIDATWLITQPNADAGADVIRAAWRDWVRDRKRVALVDSLGERGFWGALRSASAMLGNSSAGLIEAPALGLPVVNVGDRQAGRVRSVHVTDVPAQADEIERALRLALLAETRSKLIGAASLYPPGPAGPRAVAAMAAWEIPHPPRKRFVDHLDEIGA